MAFTRMLEEACAGRDASCTHVGTARWDYLTRVSASRSQSEWHKALHRMLDEHATLLGLQEMDLVVREVILVEELECSLRLPDGHDCRRSWTKPTHECVKLLMFKPLR
jgi:hypothetical protein